MDLSGIPRVSLSHLPTPLERLDNLTRHLGGPEIWIKRDDCTGLSTGGNKARKLEFLMAEALEAGADMVLTHGAVQSNHARQTAAAAARLGLECHLLLEDRTGRQDRDYSGNGNVMLDKLHGATLEFTPSHRDMNALLVVIADRLRRDGRRVYAIPGGGSNATGALGYVNAARELLEQAETAGISPDMIVHASGSAGTQAGLVVGMAASGAGVPVLGIGVRAPRPQQEATVRALAAATAKRVGRSGIADADVVANCDYVGSGYGVPGPDTLAAIRLLARLDGILLDPVYSGKGMAGLIDLVRRGRFAKGDTVVFLHTGGSASLFAYLDDLHVESDENDAGDLGNSGKAEAVR